MAEIKPYDPDLPLAYQDKPITLEPGSRAFRLAALAGYCTPEDATKVLDMMEGDPDRMLRAKAAIDVSFSLGVACAILDRPAPTPDQLRAALVRIGVDPDEGP